MGDLQGIYRDLIRKILGVYPLVLKYGWNYYMGYDWNIHGV
jgi:hypothetical protein